jgi:proteasome accessory factor B
MSTAAKLQRWVDLLGALLSRRFPATFEELRRDVPAYRRERDTPASVKRTFERDKEALRALGIPIESVLDGESGSVAGYRLRPRDFYLPYLVLRLGESGTRGAARRPSPGGLPDVVLTPDACATVLRGLARVAALGDPTLAQQARLAIAKLSHGLAPDVPPTGQTVEVVHSGTPAMQREQLDQLVEATHRRKTVTFTYRSMSRDETARRTVDPYGLVFTHGHWYLVGRCHTRQAVRQFRLGRLEGLAVRAGPATPDFERPADFSLAPYVAPRPAWTLGDDGGLVARVDLLGASGRVTQARAQGWLPAGAAADTTIREFTVRRLDAFARWVVSFGGDAVPLEPPALVAAVRALVADSLVAHAEPTA